MAYAMAAAVESGRMPPAAPDPTCAEYQDSERMSISATEIALFQAWADAGAPAGTPEEGQVWAADVLPVRDVTLLAPAYTPVFDESGNAQHCTVLDLPGSDILDVNGFEALVGSPRNVHHLTLYAAPPSDGDWPENGPDARLGFDCSGSDIIRWRPIAGWAPGASALQFPAGYAMPLDPAIPLVLQVHYTNYGNAVEPDVSGYALMLGEASERVVSSLPLANYEIAIPPGSHHHTVTTQVGWMKGDAELLAVWPHMHRLGTEFDERVLHEDGSETCLLHQDGWDVHNQLTTQLAPAVPVKSGDQLRMSCSWDNSADNPNQAHDPPEWVTIGEGLDDEMCFGVTHYALAP